MMCLIKSVITHTKKKKKKDKIQYMYNYVKKLSRNFCQILKISKQVAIRKVNNIFPPCRLHIYIV